MVVLPNMLVLLFPPTSAPSMGMKWVRIDLYDSLMAIWIMIDSRRNPSTAISCCINRNVARDISRWRIMDTLIFSDAGMSTPDISPDTLDISAKSIAHAYCNRSTAKSCVAARATKKSWIVNNVDRPRRAADDTESDWSLWIKEAWSFGLTDDCALIDFRWEGPLLTNVRVFESTEHWKAQQRCIILEIIIADKKLLFIILLSPKLVAFGSLSVQLIRLDKKAMFVRSCGLFTVWWWVLFLWPSPSTSKEQEILQPESRSKSTIFNESGNAHSDYSPIICASFCRFVVREIVIGCPAQCALITVDPFSASAQMQSEANAPSNTVLMKMQTCA